MKNKILSIKNISKKYNTLDGEIEAIENITFDLYENEFISIIGPSGCGKSTLLNILAEIETNNKGSIINDNGLKVGYMLQDDALFPWLTVLENAVLGLKINKSLNEKTKEYTKSLLIKYGLEDFINKYPNELSGGMKKRVALIRTLAIKPDVLLLDEAFSALDYVSRLEVSNDVYEIIKNENKSVIMITHDIAEAISLSDRVIVLSKRPAIVKNIYDIILEKKDTPINNRNDKRFLYYYNLLWKDLDKNVE